MENNFDLKKFLVENKLTPSAQKVDEYFSFNDKSPEGQRAKNKPSDVLGRRGQGQITPDNKDAYKNVVDKKGDMGKYYGNVGPKGSLPEMEDEEDLDEVDGGPFEYNWGKGVKIGGTNPSSLTFYFDNKLNKLIYTYKNTRGVLSNNDLKQLHDFLSQYI
jgi:hypothetical protein